MSHAQAVLFEAPRQLRLAALELAPLGAADVRVRVHYSGISTGTERLFYTGEMPPFPGMGYPLVPGYESVGEVIEAGPQAGIAQGQWVFVPGANCSVPFGASLEARPPSSSRLRSGCCPSHRHCLNAVCSWRLRPQPTMRWCTPVQACQTSSWVMA